MNQYLFMNYTEAEIDKKETYVVYRINGYNEQRHIARIVKTLYKSKTYDKLEADPTIDSDYFPYKINGMKFVSYLPSSGDIIKEFEDDSAALLWFELEYRGE